ncbi:MAG TPA: methyltransferase, partial [Bacteroidales bacterium]|nr:methyltransferase [Bacteroidales bacterium]
MDSREQLLKTINHQQPDRLVVDFGSTSVTGIHALAIENLRKYYGLEQKPVRITDPYQMLGEVDSELIDIIGIDAVPAKGKKSSFGFYNHEPLKEYLTPWGQKVLVPEGFNTTNDEKGDVFMYPEGDTSAEPSGRMPKTSYFFDAIIRQQPFDEDNLDPKDNLEEYGLISDDDLVYWKETTEKARKKGKA